MTGLTRKEAAQRLSQGLGNEQVDSSTMTVKEIVKENVFTYFNLIFTILALLLILVGSFKDLLFMIIVFANTVIGIFQEIRSKRKLDKLKFIKMPKAQVIRDGRRMDVHVSKLVLGDLVVLRAGSQIPADAVVESGSAMVNESLLTGESDEINKTEGSELMSGSFIVSGEVVARLTAVGRNSYIAKLTIEATKTKKSDDSEMIRSLNKLIKVIGILIIPIALILFVQQCFILKEGFSQSVISVVAAILGMIPEGLYMTASVAMVVSAVRLAKNDVLVQNMRCIETLARVNVLCVDKTGTITETDMQVAGYTIAQGKDEKYVKSLLLDYIASQQNDNITMSALKDYFHGGVATNSGKICGFSSKYKYSGCVLAGRNYAMGAPEYVLREAMDPHSEYINAMSEKGYRVLAFAELEEEASGQQLSGNAELLALIFLENPIREAAPETFKYFEENGVEIKVISGDNPVTVSSVAQKAGIANADRYVDATYLTSEKSMYEAVDTYTVFGRVSPEQKRMFVRALKRRGKTVGMTGDGVNDILALRDADCSIAMASGSEAASNASQLVLMDSDFSKMPSVVSEGRRVVNNLQKAGSLYLTKNIFSLLLAMFSMIAVLSYPLKPSQITLISMFTIGVPSFVLSLEGNKNLISGTFLGNVFKVATPAAITTFISVSALVIFGKVFDIPKDCISTSSTMLVALVGFMILIKVCETPTRIHVALVISMLIGIGYCIIFKSSLFGIDGITTQATMLLIVFLIATEALFRYIQAFVALMGKLITPYKYYSKLSDQEKGNKSSTY